MIHMPRSRRLLGGAIAACFAVALAITVAVMLTNAGTGSHPQADGGSHPQADGGSYTQAGPAVWRLVCGQPILKSPFSYDGAAGPYRAELPPCRPTALRARTSRTILQG